MAKVAFKNVIDEKIEFKEIDKDRLISICYDYARSEDYDLYKLVMEQKVSIFVNNELIHPDNWVYTNVVETDEIIITPIIIGGGKGGLLKIIIGAVLVVASLYAPYLGLAGVMGYGIGATTVGQIAFGIGVSLMLSGISQLLFQPDLPSLPSLASGGFSSGGGSGSSTSGSSGSKQTQTYNWSGIKTMARYDTPIPVVYGTHKVGGNIISCFVDVENGTDNYLNMLIALCEGEIEGICQEGDNNSICTTSNRSDSNYKYPAIDINDQPMHNFDNVEWWYRTGTNTSNAGYDEYYPYIQNKIPYFDGAKVQYDDGRELSTTGIEYTTTKEVDMVNLSLFSPALFKTENNSIGQNIVYYNIQYKPDSGSDWYSLKGEGTIEYWTPLVSAYPGSPNLVTAVYKDGSDRKYYEPDDFTITINSNNFESKYNEDSNYLENIPPEAGQVDTTLTHNIVYSINTTITNNKTGATTTGDVQQTLVRKIKVTSAWIVFMEDGYYKYRNQKTAKIVSEQHHYKGFDLGDYKVTINHNVQPGYNFYIMTEKGTNVTFSEWMPIQGKTTSGIYKTIKLDFNTLVGGTGRDIYNIKVKRRDEKSSDMNTQDSLTLANVVEIVQGNFIYPNTALLGIRIKATGQLSGGLPSVTTIIKGKKIEVPNFDESTSFDDSFYNDTSQTWEDGSGNTLTWDNTTFVKEYSNNSIMCIRDLMLNTRYGMGDYISIDDIYGNGIITAMKICHKSYNPYEGDEPDYLSWWDGGRDEQWSSRWGARFGSDGSVTSSSSSRYIDCSDSYNYSITLQLDTESVINTEYTISITLANTTDPVNIFLYGKRAFENEYYRFTNINAVEDGTHTATFYCNTSGISELILSFYYYGYRNDPVDFRITDISLTGVIKDHYHTWDGVIESSQSALTVLFEMCDSFRCWPVWYNGTFNFIVDEDDTPVHTITMGNMIEKSFNQTFTPLSEIPYRLIGQYTNRNSKYNMQSLIAKSTSTSLSKSNERIVGLKGIVSSEKARRELIWKLNKVTNCTNMVSFKCGLDYIHATAGDIVSVQHTLPSWGDGGRILDYNSTTNKITLDKEIIINNAATDTYLIKYQTSENDFVTATINSATLGNGNFQEVYVESWSSEYPGDDSIYAIGNENTYTKDFRLVSVVRDRDNIISVNGVEHHSTLYTEPSITIVEDRHTEIPNVLKKPPTPSVSVDTLSEEYGLGFLFNVVLPYGDFGITETIIQMSNADDNEYITIATVPKNQTTVRYVDNSLMPEKTYYFKCFSKNDFHNSDAIYISYTLEKTEYKQYELPEPTGFRIQGEPANSQTFDSKDVTIEWEPANVYGSNGIRIPHWYRIEIYKGQKYIYGESLDISQLKKETIVGGDCKFTFTLEDNKQSNKGSPMPVFTLVAYTLNNKQATSGPSLPFRIENDNPDTPTGLTSEPIVGGVKFTWDKSEELDHKSYYYRTKISSGDWGNWTETTNNTLIVTMDSDEVITYGISSTIYIEVKDRDLYNQNSLYAASTSDTANVVTDEIFKLVPSTTGDGDVEDLYDGNKTSGGITIIV